MGKYFGLGLAYSASNTPYWTQVFANSQSESCSSVTPAPVSTPVSPPVAPPITAPVTNPTASPTTAPVSTSAPVTDTNSPVSSVPSTTPVVAPNGCEMFIITLDTDSYGYETSFTLVNDHTGGTRLAGGLYASSKSFDEVTCLNNGRYIF